MGQVSELKWQRNHKLSSTLQVDTFAVSTKEGHTYVGLQFNQRRGGGVGEFRTDVAHLAHIDKLTSEYAESGSREVRKEQVGGIEVWMKRDFFPDRGEAVAVKLFQTARDGTGEKQEVGVYADLLKRAVKGGQELERELGIDQKWYALVDNRSLAKDEYGRIKAQVVASFATEAEARDRLDRSGGGLALSLEPQRREFTRGETVELWSDTKMLEKGQHHTTSVEQQLGKSELLRGRETEHFVLARWDDKYNPPRLDARTKIDGTGFGTNLQPEDFKAGYTPGRERGELDEPVWVLIEKDPNKLGAGNIRGISDDRKALEGDMKRAEAHKQEVHRAVGTEWDKQSFGMDRDQYRQGHSM